MACYLNSIQSKTQWRCHNDGVLNYITINLPAIISATEFLYSDKIKIIDWCASTKHLNSMRKYVSGCQ